MEIEKNSVDKILDITKNDKDAETDNIKEESKAAAGTSEDEEEKPSQTKRIVELLIANLINLGTFIY